MNMFDSLHYGAICEKNWEMNLADMSGYERKYTFYSDFSIAEFCECHCHDANAVVDTYNRVIKSWGKSIKEITEVVLVLNHKIWSFYGNVDSKYLKCSDEWREKFMNIYQELYDKCVNFIDTQYRKGVYSDEDMHYYWEVTD